MITQPYQLCMERIDKSRNMARYYALSIEPTLLGNASLVRRWGRIGTFGQQKIEFFDDESGAIAAFFSLLHEKRARGYRTRRPLPTTGT